MKRNKLFKLFVVVLSIGTIALMSSCKGDDGAMGPAGAAGTDGANGTDGTPGVDGNEVCLQCHNVTKKSDVTADYLTSVHATGGAVSYAGGRYGCAKCHSDQGFRETQYTGEDTTAANILSPQPIQCGTCHDFHQSLDFANEPNYALRTVKPVDLLMYRSADPTADPVTIDLGPEANTCANCHQPRRLPPNSTDDSTAVTSTHYGPHYGTQSTTLSGLGAYEIGTGYPDPGEGSPHATSAVCTTCHMHGGEHTWEPNLESCNTSTCHNGALTSVSENSRQITFRTLMSTLESELKDAGLLDADGTPVKGTFETDEVGALYNYRWLYSDHSSGTHNFPYSETLLNNSIAVFQ